MPSTLQTLTRLPRAAFDAAQATTVAARRIAALQRTVIDRLGSLDRSVRDIAAALPTVVRDIAQIRATVQPQYERVTTIEGTIARLETRLAELQTTLKLLNDEVKNAAALLPDPDAAGPITKVKDALSDRS